MSGTSAAAAVAAGAAAVLAQGRPRASAAALKSLLVGSSRPVGSGGPLGAGRLDLDAAVLREVAAEPATVAFGAVGSGRPTLARRLTVRNVSTRDLVVRIAPRPADGVDVEAGRPRLRLRAGASGEVVLRAETANLAEDARAAVGVVELRVQGSPIVRVPWSVVSPSSRVDLLSHVSLKTTGKRVSDATPAVLGLVVGAVVPAAAPEVRPVDVLEVQLWRNAKLLGVLAKRRELLPGRYTFGLTGRGPDGARLRGREYTIRVVARPADGTRRQVESFEYVLR